MAKARASPPTSTAVAVTPTDTHRPAICVVYLICCAGCDERFDADSFSIVWR
ncbi:MAG: hypothetical protein R2856_34350 [Caldilineaceae bacterium]